MLNKDPWQGFSSDGGLLSQLATSDGSAAATIKAQLNGQDELEAASMAAATGLDTSIAATALAELAMSGLLGFDLARDGYFHSVMPYAYDRVKALNSRLKAAEKMLSQDAVRSTKDCAEVRSDGTTDRLRSSDAGWDCTCPWHAQNARRRGPCKHALAV